MKLVWPAEEYLPSYREALRNGWSPDTTRGAEGALEELDKVDADPVAYIGQMVDREAKGPPVKLPDGTTVPRLPGIRLWMWDDAFCGVIGLRWQLGTEELPPHCLGHIGYTVLPDKRNKGYASAALAGILPLARAEGLRFVTITTSPENIASQRVIEKNQGEFVENFELPAQYGGGVGLRYRIPLGSMIA